MWKALVLKELRELAPIAGIALAAYACITAHAVGVEMTFWPTSRTQEIPFVTDEFSTQTTFISFCLAIALAMKQTLPESSGGTWAWLLHRPVSRALVMAVKLTTGGLVYLACAALPIVFYAGWAATPGTHASPFFWSMTMGAWQSWMIVGVLYLGAFLSALRPGRWAGTRLLPLVGAAVLAITGFAFFELSASVVALAMVWAWPFLLSAVLASTVLFVGQTRDF